MATTRGANETTQVVTTKTYTQKGGETLVVEHRGPVDKTDILYASLKDSVLNQQYDEVRYVKQDGQGVVVAQLNEAEDPNKEGITLTLRVVPSIHTSRNTGGCALRELKAARSVCRSSARL
jgi:hypothetical protein